MVPELGTTREPREWAAGPEGLKGPSGLPRTSRNGRFRQSGGQCAVWGTCQFGVLRVKPSAMPQEILATRWRRKGEFEDSATGLPFAGLLLAGAFLNAWWLVIPALGFGVAGFTLQRIRFRRCRCEKCGSKLHRQPKEGAVSFACASCDIIWITRVHQDLQ